ncbi:hypothetical protein [Komagataeibacter xylinus]|uniref:Uncharacterized protein n=1 Tax=Komagataeibacter xylinus TaxID=28448 RepID=A0A857FNQ0_KOMXY|nr:hypothetical protein [Komagataeibacter xylinus]QHC35129.1 hypothetical protein FMA36_06065 [Komagataeibacter xylinus]
MSISDDCVSLKKNLEHVYDMEKFVNEMMRKGIVNGWDGVLEKFQEAKEEITKRMKKLGC